MCRLQTVIPSLITNKQMIETIRQSKCSENETSQKPRNRSSPYIKIFKQLNKNNKSQNPKIEINKNIDPTEVSSKGEKVNREAATPGRNNEGKTSIENQEDAWAQLGYKSIGIN